MAKRKKRHKVSRRRSGLGYNADANQAIKLARQGKCDLAWAHVVDAGGHNYPKTGDQDEAHFARVIVNQHCGRIRSRRVKVKRTGKYVQHPRW